MVNTATQSSLMVATPAWEAVRELAQKFQPDTETRTRAGGFLLARLERIGDTTSHGVDMVVNVDDPRWVFNERGAMFTRDNPSFIVERGQARVVERDGQAVILARTESGEYRACMMLPPGKEHDEWLELHALMLARQRWTHDSALPVPVEAGAIQRLLSGGRELEARKSALSTRVRAKVDTEFHAQRGKREVVTVELVVPKVRGMKLRIRAEHPIFPELASADKRELPALVGEALARAMQVRAYQAVLAGMSLVFKEGGVRLEDGELPDKFRFEVMRVMGMPSRAASAAQRQLVRDAMQFLVHAEVLVKPTDGARADYLPILVRHGYADDPTQAERRPSLLALNPELMPAMDSGHRWLVPEALFQVSDDADRDGVTRLLGFQLAHRLGMGTSGHEKLEKMLRRAGLWEWAQRQDKSRRGTYVMDALRRALDELRALPHAGHAPADIVGGTVIVGTELSDGRVEYHDAPPWTRSSG
jgi:hypothetical protein